MLDIFKSASKIVFILVAITACVALFTKNLTGENFMVLAGAAFAYYFSKGNNATQIKK